MKSLLILAVLAINTQAQSSPVSSPRRGIALLIGNIHYPDDPLDSVTEDLRGMQEALSSIGFETDIATDLDRPEEYRSRLRQFLEQRKASANDIVLVFYSGHGLQLEGSTYLLGKNYRTVVEPQAAAFGHAFSVDELVRELERSPPFARIVIVDACRNNAFSSQGQRGGVALRQNYANTVIIFSDEPGKTVPARSITGLRSPFVEALIYALTTKTTGIKEIFERTRDATIQLSPTQVPQMLTSMDLEQELLALKMASAPSRRAFDLVNQAKQIYLDRLWPQFCEILQQAKAVTVDPELRTRINNELIWLDSVEAAEREATARNFLNEAKQWDRASQLFPARSWTIERAAVARLMADREDEAIPLFFQLTFATNTVISTRARSVLDSLVRREPALGEIVRQQAPPSRTNAQEFELVKP